MKTFLDDKYTFLHLGYESDHSTINGIVDNLLLIAENNFVMYKAMHKNDPDLDVSEFSDVDGNYIRLVYEHRLNQFYWKKLFVEFDICHKVCFEKYKELCREYNIDGERLTTPSFNKGDTARFFRKLNIKF